MSLLVRYDTYITFWDNVYSFNMKCMKSEVLKEATVETSRPETVVTEPSMIAEIDLTTCTTDTPNFTSNFELKVVKSGELTALAGYFDTFFDLTCPVQFSTGPLSPKTHWQQTLFYLKNVVEVTEGKFVARFLLIEIVGIKSKIKRAMKLKIKNLHKLYVVGMKIGKI